MAYSLQLEAVCGAAYLAVASSVLVCGCGRGDLRTVGSDDRAERAEGLVIDVEQRVGRDVAEVETSRTDRYDVANLRGRFQTPTVVHLGPDGTPHVACGGDTRHRRGKRPRPGASYE